MLVVTLMEAASHIGHSAAFSPFLEQLSQSLNISKNTISTAYTAANLITGLLLPFIGNLFDHLSGRIFCSGLVIAFGALFFTLGSSQFIVIHMGISAGLVLFICFAGVRTCTRGFSVLTRSITAMWFDKNLKWAASLSGVLLAIIASIVPWFVYRLSQLFSQQHLWHAEGILFILLFLPFCLSIRKNKDRTLPSKCACKTDFTFLKKYVFWAFSFALFIQALQNTGLAFHLVHLCNSMQINPEKILKSFMPISIISLFICILSNHAFNRVGPKKIFYCFCCNNIALICSLLFLNQASMQFLFIITCGINWGMIHTLLYMTWPYLFGHRSIGTVNGIAVGFINVGSALGPLFFSYTQSAYSYQALFYILLVATSIALLGIKCAKVSPFNTTSA